MTHSMRMLIGLVPVWLATALLIPVGTAAAAGQPCLPSGGCASTQYTGDLTGHRGGQLRLRWRITLTGTDIAGASLYVDSPAGLTLSPDSVTLNGAPAPAGSVRLSAGGPDFTVDLGSLLPLATAPGAITVGYTAEVATTAKPEIVVGTDLGYGDAGGVHFLHNFPVTATVQVAFPDLAVSTTGTDTYIPRGQEAGVSFGITNSGQVDPPDVTLVIRTSAGFTLTNPPYFAVHCHPIGIRSTQCTIPYRPPVVADSLGIRAEPSTPPDQTGDLTLTAEPLSTPPDLNPTDNTHHMRLHVRGIADLSVRWRTPAGGAIPLGRPTTITAEVTNTGPDPATGLVGWIELPQGSGSSDFRVVARSSAVTGQSTRQVWLHIPRLAAHTTYPVSLRVTGLRVGARGAFGLQFTYPSFSAMAGLAEPVVSYDPTAAEESANVAVTVVANTAPTTGQSLPATGPGQSLPATGPGRAIPAAIIGAALLLTGLALLLLARRRRW